MSDTITIALHAGEDSGAPPNHGDLTWEQMLELFATVEETPCAHESPKDSSHCKHKKGMAWSPAVFDGGGRRDVNVIEFTAIVFDLDGITDEELERVAERLQGYRYLAHTTHSHAVSYNCYRVVLPLSRRVKAKDWKRFWTAVLNELKLPADPTCKSLARLYFLPRVSIGAPREFSHGEGRVLDVEAFLKAPVRQEVPLGAAPPPVEDGTVVDLSDLRTILAKASTKKLRTQTVNAETNKREREHGVMLRRLLDGEPIAVHPDDTITDADVPRGRDQTLNRAMSVVANVVPLLTPFEAIDMVIRKSVFAMSSTGENDGVEYWMAEAEDMYVRAIRRRAEYEEGNRASLEAQKVQYAELLRRVQLEGKAPKPAEPAGDDDSEDDQGDEDDENEDWKQLLQRDEKQQLRGTGHNAWLIMSNCKELKGFLRFNVLTKRIEITGGLFAKVSLESLHTSITDWLGFAWDVTLGRAEVQARIVLIARENPYNPIHDYLTPLKWDGVNRLDTWLEKYAGAHVVNDDGVDITKWVRLISRRWMIALVARALRPGCQVDTVLILESRQGAGKTSLLRALAHPWHRDDKIIIGDKDSRMAAAASWLVEIGELAAMRKGDLETYKAFFSQKVDFFRLPYGQTMEEFPRGCVFVGTTNEEGDYLADLTGNRRFWSVRCGALIDVAGITQDRDQLLAEAVVALEAGEPWWLDVEQAEGLERDVTAARVSEPDAIVEVIRNWWLKNGKKYQYVTTQQVFAEALGSGDALKITRPDSIKVGRALKILKFKKFRKRIGDAVAWVYGPPPGPMLQLVVEGSDGAA